jgi:epoxyqueuosine reductase
VQNYTKKSSVVVLSLKAEQYSKQIKQIAQELGFDFCGIAKVEFLEKEAPRLENWLNKGFHGQMSYMENHFDKRLNPALLVPGAKSVISLLYNYYPETKLPESEHDIKISKYAYGEDYHTVLKDKLKLFLQTIRQQIGEVEGRVFVDSAPVMDKAWAQKAGLGWIGKHSNLINRSMGSFFFIAELIIDLELIPDGPIKDYCGTCKRCIEACPTDSITPYEVDGSKCISYFTIELKDAIPEEMSGKFQNWAFGCDICQDVCPWNKFSSPHKEERFLLNDSFANMNNEQWLSLEADVFQELFKRSAVKRTKFEGLKRNIEFLKNNRKK